MGHLLGMFVPLFSSHTLEIQATLMSSYSSREPFSVHSTDTSCLWQQAARYALIETLTPITILIKMLSFTCIMVVSQCILCKR
jgi:hypothetical protein